MRCSAMMLLLTVVLVTTAGLSPTTHASGGDGGRESTKPSITLTPYRSVAGVTADFTTEVGREEGFWVLTATCSGSDSIPFTITHTHPMFRYIGPSDGLIDCVYPRQIYGSFTPTEPGLQIDTVTLTGPNVSASIDVIGNAVPRERAEQWIIDLGNGSRASRILFDSGRDLIYVSDFGNNEVIAVSPAERKVIARMKTGKQPVGMSISVDGRQLYVANSGEASVTSIDLNSRIATQHPVPNLMPGYGWDEPYYPFEIAVVSDRLALLSSAPPGYASGGPLMQLDLRTFEVTPRYDMVDKDGYPIRAPRATMQTSRDRSTVGIIPEYGGSWTELVRYKTTSDSFFSFPFEFSNLQQARDLVVNNNGSRMISTNVFEPALTVFDQDLRIIMPIKLDESPVLDLAFNPAAPKYVYGLGYGIAEVRLDLGRQTRRIQYEAPAEYVHAPLHSLAMSDDGEWLYTPLVRTALEPPAKLLAVRVGSRGPADYLAPVSEMQPLAPRQTRNWWKLSWTGSDDVSGVDFYVVEYRRGETGDWLPWTRTMNTSALFTGATPGQRYDFRVYGTDIAGNIETYTDTAEATTVAGEDTSGLIRTFLPLVKAR